MLLGLSVILANRPHAGRAAPVAGAVADELTHGGQDGAVAGEEGLAEAHPGSSPFVDHHRRPAGPGGVALGGDAQVAGITHQEEGRHMAQCMAQPGKATVQPQGPLGYAVAAGAEGDQVTQGVGRALVATGTTAELAERPDMMDVVLALGRLGRVAEPAAEAVPRPGLLACW